MDTELLRQGFSWVCGQNPAHTWFFEGAPCPCCQRCTGLYTGAAAALLLHLLVRPGISRRFLFWHALLLVQMIPFGCHWVEQGALVRTLTGHGFGYGVTAFLWNLPADRQWVPTRSGARAAWQYAGGLVASTTLVLGFVPRTRWPIGGFIALWVAAGGVALAALVLANAAILGGLLVRRWRPPLPAPPRADRP